MADSKVDIVHIQILSLGNVRYLLVGLHYLNESLEGELCSILGHESFQIQIHGLLAVVPLCLLRVIHGQVVGHRDGVVSKVEVDEGSHVLLDVVLDHCFLWLWDHGLVVMVASGVLVPVELTNRQVYCIGLMFCSWGNRMVYRQLRIRPNMMWVQNCQLSKQ